MRTKGSQLASCSALIVAVFLANGAHAQATAEPPAAAAAVTTSPAANVAQPAGSQPAAAVENGSHGLTDIVVYAQRRSAGAQLQKVPMAVTAVDSNAMAAAHTIDLRDIGRLVPNAQLDPAGTYPGFANFFIRGIGVSTSIRSIDPAINIIQDGMVIGYQAGAVLDTFDLEDVEVLRGPQGVLFGRNASGGAIVLRSKRPKDTFGVHVDVLVGNGHEADIHASVEGPIIPGLLDARLAVSRRYNDGLWDNTTDGRFVAVPGNVAVQTGQPVQHPTGGIANVNEIVVKPSFLLTPSDTTKFTLMTQYQNYKDGGGPSRAYIPAQGTLAGLQTAWGYYPTTGKYQTNIPDQGYTDIIASHVIGELVQQVNDRDTITVTAAYRQIKYNSTLNVSGDPFGLIVFPNNRERNHQTSVEARYNGHITNNLEFLVGGFYLDMFTHVNEYRITRSPTKTTGTYFVNIWSQHVRSYAAFGNLDWKPFETLTLSAGLRYSNDRKSIDIIPLQTCTGVNFTGCPTTYYQSADSWHNVSPRFVANYQPTNNLTLYASYSKGYRAGNYNARATTVGSATLPANPETVGSYEVGIKSEWLNHHLRLNLTGFSEDYSNIQRVVQGTDGTQAVQSLFNAASANIKGIEFEGSILPFRGFRIDATAGYTHAKYNRFIGVSGLPAGVVATDLEFDRVPKWTEHVEATYGWDMLDGKMSLRGSYTHRSHVFTDVNNTPQLAQNAYKIIDASLSFDRKHYSISVFGRNLTNTYYADIQSLGQGYQAYGGSPRTYGVQLGYTF
jgi:iron complex outermembrane receptor protein